MGGEGGAGASRNRSCECCDARRCQSLAPMQSTWRRRYTPRSASSPPDTSGDGGSGGRSDHLGGSPGRSLDVQTCIEDAQEVVPLENRIHENRRHPKWRVRKSVGHTTVAFPRSRMTVPNHMLSLSPDAQRVPTHVSHEFRLPFICVSSIVSTKGARERISKSCRAPIRGSGRNRVLRPLYREKVFGVFSSFDSLLQEVSLDCSLSS